MLPNTEILTLSPHRIKCHHPKCPKMNQSPPKSQEHRHSIRVQTGDAASTAGSIIIPNCNNSQLSSPDLSEPNEVAKRYLSALNVNNIDERDEKQKTFLLKIPSVKADQLVISLDFKINFNLGKICCFQSANGIEFLSPPTSNRRRSSVMFNEYVILHTPTAISECTTTTNKNVSLSEKTTQAGDGNIWQVTIKLYACY